MGAVISGISVPEDSSKAFPPFVAYGLIGYYEGTGSNATGTFYGGRNVKDPTLNHEEYEKPQIGDIIIVSNTYSATETITNIVDMVEIKKNWNNNAPYGNYSTCFNEVPIKDESCHYMYKVTGKNPTF